jgi:hypothetical protein
VNTTYFEAKDAFATFTMLRQIPAEQTGIVLKEMPCKPGEYYIIAIEYFEYPEVVLYICEDSTRQLRVYNHKKGGKPLYT